jgi:ABC-type lipoprotein export system ATPase subunit
MKCQSKRTKKNLHKNNTNYISEKGNTIIYPMNSNAAAGPMIETHTLSRTYMRGLERVEALKNVNLSINSGTFAIIFGPSGGGKSTLLHLLGGIDRPTSGSLIVSGKPLEKLNEAELTRFRRGHIGFVFQFYNLLSSINAIENVALPLLAKGMHRRKALEHARSLLERVGLNGRALHKPSQLSGGEQQRVTIARAIAGEPAIVLADEPTGDLDAKSSDEIIQLMLDINHELGTTFVVATHNERFMAFADRLFVLRSGELSETQPA